VEADKLSTINVNISGDMQVIIHNINTNKSSFLQEKDKHTSRHVGEEKSETGTHCRLRDICKYTIQYNNTIQYKSIQFNDTITTQADREVERMAITSTHCRQ